MWTVVLIHLIYIVYCVYLSLQKILGRSHAKFFFLLITPFKLKQDTRVLHLPRTTAKYD